VLVFGTLLARFINRLVFAWLNNLGVNGSLTISTIAEYAVQIFAVFVALEQLNIGTQLITAAFIILFGSVCLALALAFGLGGKEWAAGVIENPPPNLRKNHPNNPLTIWQNGYTPAHILLIPCVDYGIAW